MPVSVRFSSSAADPLALDGEGGPQRRQVRGGHPHLVPVVPFQRRGRPGGPQHPRLLAAPGFGGQGLQQHGADGHHFLVQQEREGHGGAGRRQAVPVLGPAQLDGDAAFQAPHLQMAQDAVAAVHPQAGGARGGAHPVQERLQVLLVHWPQFGHAGASHSMLEPLGQIGVEPRGPGWPGRRRRRS